MNPVASFVAPLLVAGVFAADVKITPLAVPNGGKAGFTLMSPAETGVKFTNYLTEAAAEKNRILENGAGVALGDFDGDGTCDIYICGTQRRNALFRNLGNWKFEEVSTLGAADCRSQVSTGAVFADVDGDGHLDLLVNGLGAGTRLFRNDGKGNFVEDENCGLNRACAATSLALADIDGDGDLDLYVTTYRANTIRDGPVPGFKVSRKAGKLEAEPAEQFEFKDTPTGPELVEKGEADFLYLNDGTGKFTAVSWTDGRFRDEDGNPLRSAPQRWGLSVVMRDLNGDGAPDIYVCNDFLDGPDEVWINDGKGNFRALPKLAMRHTSWSSMSVDIADINRDGLMDIFVADMLSPNNIRRQTQRANAELSSIRHLFGVNDNRPQIFQNTLQLNRGDGTFAEIAQLAGLQATEWTWSAVFLDVDLDGREDLLLTTGNLHDIQDADTANRIAPLLNTPPHLRPPVLHEYPPLKTPRQAYRNNGNLGFSEVGREWGFDQVGVSQAMAVADLDGDGDLDVVVVNLNDNVGLYRNDSVAPRLHVHLGGSEKNSEGVGALIQVAGGAIDQRQEIVSGGRYLSGDQAARTFAAAPTNVVTVRWRDGTVSEMRDVPANVAIEVSQSSARREEQPPTSAPRKWFAEDTTILKHNHIEDLYDDWAVQPFLPNRLSQTGPSIGIGDSIIITSTLNSPVSYFRKTGNTFVQGVGPVTPGDSEAITRVRLGEKQGWAIAINNYETGSVTNAAVLICAESGGQLEVIDQLPGQAACASALCYGKIDSGDPVLFVGSRSTRARYPEASPSRFYRQHGAGWKLDRKLSEQVADAGLVSDGVLIDVNGDGALDLVLACDWSPPKIYINEKGGLTNATERLGLTKFSGRWNKVVTGDFDGDGKPDLVFGNWGRNTRAQKYLSKPLKLMYGDFDGDQHLEMLESFFDPELEKYVPWRGRVTVARHVPGVSERFPTFAAYGAAGTEEILAGLKYETVEAATLDTILFLNRGEHFEPAPLPVEAQFAPVFGIAIADFDGDGKLDIYLPQNFFALHDEVPRMDAGRGLLLAGDGRGGFRAVPAQESGIEIYGDQRGCAAADLNGDGKPDLVCTQNAGPTKVFLNRTGSR